MKVAQIYQAKMVVFFHGFLNSDIWESLSLDLVFLNSRWFMLNVHSIVLLIVY